MSNYGYQIFDSQGVEIHNPTDTEIRALGTGFFDISGPTLPATISINLTQFKGSPNWVAVLGTRLIKGRQVNSGGRSSFIIGGEPLYSFSHISGSTAVLSRIRPWNGASTINLGTDFRFLNGTQYWSRSYYLVGRRI